MKTSDLITLKQMIIQALEECTDADILDLILKILIYDKV